MDRQKRDAIAEAAGFWDARLRAPGCTDSDRRDFAAWRDADPAHREAFERIQTIVTTLRDERSRADLRALRDAALAMADRRRTRVRWTAAASIGVLALTALLWALAPRVAELGWGAANTFQTGTGQRSTVKLQDGSTVDLNSRTRIRVAFSDARRSVTLLEGQAIFQVSKDPSRPFVVHAGNREIVALGTTFDVRLDAAAVQVTLVEGKVAVVPEGGATGDLKLPVAVPDASVDSPQAGTASAPHQRGARPDAVYLSPGQQLVVSRSGGAEKVSAQAAHPEPRAIDVTKVTSWRNGYVFFEDLGLAQAVAEMNKHSKVQIVLADPSLDAYRINGMFRAGEQQVFAQALEAYFPIAVEQRDETRIVLHARR
jgi:transmembrane sensor